MNARTVFWAMCLLLSPGVVNGQGGIETFSGETLGEGLLRATVSYAYERRGNLYSGSDHVGDTRDALYQRHTAVVSVDYGLLPELTLSLFVPFTHRELRFDQATGGTEKLPAYGLGDVSVAAKLRLWKLDWKRSAFHLSAIGGLKLPTGEPSERHEGQRLPPFVQPGTGSWDPFLGLASTLSVQRVRFDLHGVYRLNTEGRLDLEWGDEAWVEFDAAYRIVQPPYPGPTASVKLGARWSWEDRRKQDGDYAANTGFWRISLRPGLTLHPIPRMDITTSLDVPVYQHYKGRQLARDVAFQFAFGLRF